MKPIDTHDPAPAPRPVGSRMPAYAGVAAALGALTLSAFALATAPRNASDWTPVEFNARVERLAVLLAPGCAEGPTITEKLVFTDLGLSRAALIALVGDKTRDSALRANAIAWLPRAGENADAAAALIALLNGDTRSVVGRAALEALAAVSAEAAVPYAEGGLGDDDPVVRETAIRALARAATPAARALLKRAAAGDPSPSLRMRAQSELTLLSGTR